MFLINAQLNLDLSKGSGSKLKTEVEALIGGIKGKVSIEVSSKSKQDIAELARNLDALRNSMKALSLESANAASTMNKMSGGMNSVSSNTKTATSSITGATVATQSLNKAMGEGVDLATAFGTQAGLAGRRFLAFTAATTSMFTLVRALKAGVSEAIEFDLAINKLKQVSDEGSKGVANLRSTIQDLAKNLGVSSLQLSEAATAFTQAGISARDSAKAVEAFGLALLTPNFGNAKNTIEGMIALYQQFGKDADNLKNQLGSINAVAGAFASEAEDLVTAVQKAGGVFATTGGKLEELLAIMTSVRATTRESADSIATGLRSIFTYVQRTETVDALKLLNINLRRTREEAEALGDVDLAEQFVGPYEAIQRLSAGLSKLRSTDPRYSQIVEDLGGVRQVSRVLPLIQQFGEAQKALNVARVGAASLETAAAIRQDALVTKLTKIRETYQQLTNDLLQSKGFKSLIDFIGETSNAIDKLVRTLSPLLPVLGGLALGNLAKFGLTAGAAFVSTVKAPSTIIHRSSGGPVPGYGNGDTVPAMLEGGEYVIKKDSAQKIGYGNLNSMNAKGYANGGQFNIPVYNTDPYAKLKLLNGPTPTIQKVLSKVNDIGLNPEALINAIEINSSAMIGGVQNLGAFYHNRKGVAVNNIAISHAKPLAKTSTFSSVLAHEIGHGLDYSIIEQLGKKGYVSDFSSQVPGSGLASTGSDYLDNPQEKFADVFASLITGQAPANRRQIPSEEKIGLINFINQFAERLPGLRAKKFATGGSVFGGSSDEDSVNARLTPGEFVLRKAAADKIGHSTLEYMNKKGKLPGYAKGGRVKRDEDAPFRLPDEAYQNEIDPKFLLQKATYTSLESKIEDLDKAFGGLGTLAEKVTKTVNNTIAQLKNKFPRADAESSPAIGTGLAKAVQGYTFTDKSTSGGFLNFIRNGIIKDFKSEFSSDKFKLSTATTKAIEAERGPFPKGQKGSGSIEFLKNLFSQTDIDYEAEAKKYHLSTKPGETLSKLTGLFNKPKIRSAEEINIIGKAVPTKELDQIEDQQNFVADLHAKELKAKQAEAATEAEKQAKLTLKRATTQGGAVKVGGSLMDILAARKAAKPNVNLLNALGQDYQYGGDDSKVDSILSSIGKPPISSGRGSGYGESRFPLVGPLRPIAALPPYIPPSLKYALPGGPGGGPGGFILGDPSRNPVTRGLKQTEQQYPVGFTSAFGLSLNPEDKTTRGYEGGLGLNDGTTRNLNLASFNATTAFGLATNRNIKFPPSAGTPNGSAFIGAGSDFNFTSSGTQGPPRRLGTIHGDPLFNATKDGFNDYANNRIENNLRTGDLYGLRGTKTFDAINQTKLNKEIDALAEGIRRQLKALNIGLTKEERLNAARDLAVQAYEQNNAVVRNGAGQAVGLKSLGEAPVEGFFGRNYRRAGETLGRTRLGRAAGYLGSKIGANGGVTAAFGLSTAASFAGDAFSPNQGLLNSQVEAGQERQYSRDTQIGGTLQGAALGASIGLAGGPVGAAIGGVIGGLYGLTSSLKKASIDISNAKIDIAIQKINEKLKPIVSGKNPLSSTNEEELVQNINVAKNSALITSALETSSLFRATDPKVLAKENQKQLRVAFAGQAGDFAAVLSEELGREAKKPNANADDIFKSFQGGGRGTLFKTLTDIRGISTTTANKELKEDIRLALQNAQANKTVEKGDDEAKRLSTAFSRLTLAVTNAIETTDKFKDSLDVISGGTGKVFGLTGGLQQFGAPAGNEFNKSVTSISNFVGPNAGQLSRTAIAGNQLQSVLPEILAEVASQGFNEKESESQRVFKLLDKRVDTKNPEIASGIAVLLRGIEEESRKNKGDALRDARVDSSKLSEQLLQPFTGPAKEALERIGKEFEGFFNSQLSGFAALRSRQGEADTQRTRGFDLGLNTTRARADLSAELLGGGGGGRLLSFDTLVNPFKQRQASLVSGLGVTNPEDPKELADKLSKTLQARDTAKENVNKAFGAGDATGTQKAIKDFTELGYQANRLDQALKTLIDPTQKLAAIQERLAHLQEDRESRLSFGERFINADGNERQNIIRGQRLVAQLAQNPGNAGNRFQQLGADNQRLALREARSIGSGQFANGLTGNSLANLLIGSTGVLNQQKETEIKALLGERVNTAGGSEAANNSLTKILGDENQKFLNSLEKSLSSFTDRLQLNFSSLNALQAKNLYDTGKARSDVLQKQQRQSALLGSVGIDTVSGTGSQIDERLRIARSEQAKKALDKFFTARDEFAPYNRNVETLHENINEVTGRPSVVEGIRSVNRNPGLGGSARLAALNALTDKLDIPTELKTILASNVSDQFEGEFNKNRKRKGYAGREDVAIQDTLESLLKSNLRPLFGAEQENRRNQFIKAGNDVSAFGFNANLLGETNDVSKIKEALDAFNEQGQSLGSLNQRIKESEESLKKLKDTADLLQKQFEILAGKNVSPSLFGIPLEAQKRAGGGSIFQPNGSDIVPAMLSPDEFVVNARSAKANRALLEQINNSNGVLQPGLDLSPPSSIPIGPSSTDSLNDKLLSRGGPVYLAGGGFARGLSDPTRESQIPGRRKRSLEEFGQVGPPDSLDKGNGLGEGSSGSKGFSGQISDSRFGRAYGLYDSNSEFALDKLNDYYGSQAQRVAPNNIGNYVGSRLRTYNNRRQLSSLLEQQVLAGTEDEIYGTGIDRLRDQESAAQAIFNQRFGTGFRTLAEENYRKRIGRDKKGRTNKFGIGKGYAGNVDPNGTSKPSFFDSLPFYAQRFANGGVVTGGIPGQDSVPALLTPGEVVIPNKGGPASGGLDKLAEQTNKLANSFVTFNEPAMKLSSSINAFSEKSDALAAALDRFPREVSHSGNFEVNVNHNGAEIFTQLTPELKKLIINEASKMIGEEFNRRIPEATSKLKGDTTSIK